MRIALTNVRIADEVCGGWWIFWFSGARRSRVANGLPIVLSLREDEMRLPEEL